MNGTTARIADWISRHRFRVYVPVSLLILLPATIFIYWAANAWPQSTWVVPSSVITLGLVYAMLSLALVIFLGRFYEQLEMGSKFTRLSLDLFCVVGSDGYFKYLNSSWQELLGFTTAELMSRPYLEFVHPDDGPSTVAEAEKLEGYENTVAFENRYVCRDGSYKWLLWNATAVRGQQLIYAAARDITEIKQASKKIEQQNRELESHSRQVEQATRLKSMFLASMSHELRTPLNAIVGFSGLLADERAGGLNHKQKRYLTHIQNGANHLIHMINDILDLSKIEAGQLDIRSEEFQVQDVLPEVLATIRPLAAAKNIELSYQLEAGSAVYADPVRLKQILYNLLSNALKFTPESGQISVESADEATMVRITVADTGIGIHAEDHDLIFEEFRQVEGERAQEGTGLGLAITRRLVEQQGGRIWLESALDKGARFSFTVPARAPVPALETAGNGSHRMHDRKPLILIVDDQAPARELLASYLQPEGYSVALAASAAEGLQMACQLRPAAIMLDILMPNVSGFEALLALKARPETADIPIIVVSISDQWKMGFALGAADYLLKPVAKSVLLDTVLKHTLPQPSENGMVLIVEDDPAARELLSITLQEAGHKIRAVPNGKEALATLSTMPVSAILLDLLMPEMDGFELIHHIKQQPRLKQVPLFVLTAKNLSGDEIAVLARETRALFQKDGSWRSELVTAMELSLRESRNLELKRGA
jgi:PAS domain S-box-containing protein